MLGYPERGYNHIQLAIDIAREVEHPFTQAMALATGAFSYCRVRETQEATECLDTLLPLAEEQNFNMWVVNGSLVRGIAWTQSGFEDIGIQALIQGLSDYQSMGSEVSRAYHLASLAYAQVSAGQAKQALSILEQALAHVDKSGERFGEADIYRIKGDLLLLSDPGEGKAEDCYHRSLGIAKQQNAKSWELRTSMRLSHLWQKQGRIQEAKELLAGIYGWFTEGFDTPDLVDAKALLEELA